MTDGARAGVRELARAAGVSPATVSRVLNGSTAVAPDTAERVRAAILEVGGVPPARRPGRPRAVRVFVRCPYVLTDYFGFIVSSVADSLAAVGWRLELDAGNATQQRQPLHDVAARADVAGAIVVLPPEPAATFAPLVEAGFPLVVVDPREPLPGAVASVAANHLAAGRRLAEHLVGLGHRRIASVVGPRSWQASTDRVAGLAAALAAVGTLPDPELVRSIDPTFEQGAQVVGELLDLPEPPTAVLCFNDKVAVGALRAATERGLRVPDDLSVTGFDDLDVGHVTDPPLTTVRQPMEEMGRLAVSLLRRLIEGEAPTTPHLEVATELVLRGSTGPVPGRATFP